MNFKKNKLNHGFTLIELLIVIAIIGILAAVLIPNLMSARDKANDASIISQMKMVQTQSQIWYQDHGGVYRTSTLQMCSPTEFGYRVVGSINTILGGVGNGVELTDDGLHGVVCHVATDGKKWAMSARLKTNPDLYFCVDSEGHAGVSAQYLAASTSVETTDCTP